MTTLAQTLHSQGLPVFPCRADKGPAVAKGVSWRDVSQQAPQTLHWPSPLVGVPIPDGVVVIDLDTYKGVTREQADAWLGVALPWDDALIQTTGQGGQHYAFSADWPVSQGSDLGDIKGLDTRTAGQGYICTGGAYQWAGFGVMRMRDPPTLPRLPDSTRAKLERVQVDATAATLPEGNRDIDLIRDALRHIDADCSRAEWVEVGMALKHHFHDDEATGFAMFQSWSEQAADRLDYETLPVQWESFKATNEGGPTVTVASVIYKAMQAGFIPPKGFDTSAAFGAGATADEFGRVVDSILATGSDPKSTTGLVASVQAVGGSETQRSTLAALLRRELKDAGLLTKAVGASIDKAITGGAIDYQAPGMYGKNHTENAVLFLTNLYPGGTLMRSDEIWYAYDGKCWQEQTDDHVKHTLFSAMATSRPQDSTINGAYGVLCKMCFTQLKIGQTPAHLVIYTNGVLDLNTGQLMTHSPQYFTTNMLPYSYAPEAYCSEWLGFLDQVTQGDDELVALLQEWFGYMMVTSYRYQKIMLIVGPRRGGKGTIGKVMQQVIGKQSFSGGSLQSFVSDKFLDSLRSKPVMFIGDAEQRVPRNHASHIIERLKTISGNDAISFDRIYKSSLTETLPTRITIASNHTPSLFDDSGALANRFLLWPINVGIRSTVYIFLTSGAMTMV